MDAIRLFLENMFYGISSTPAVLRAKEDLLAMMEDKYHELKATGKSENEAVGQVIAEFGNLEELADSLGIKEELHRPAEESSGPNPLPTLVVSAKEAHVFLDEKKKFGRNIGLGVMLCILSPLLLVVLDAVYEARGHEASDLQLLPGLVALFCMVALAVMIFIINGVKSEKYRRFNRKNIVLDQNTRREVEAISEKENMAFATQISLGVVLVVLGVLSAIVLGALGTENVLLDNLAGMGPLVFTSFAVYLFITAGVRKSSLNQLLNRGEYEAEKQESDKVVERIAGPYWLIIVVIYLAWSFLTMNWHISWIIWPIAGVLFAVISAVVNAIRNTTD